jgi:hypothetical protein
MAVVATYAETTEEARRIANAAAAEIRVVVDE